MIDLGLVSAVRRGLEAYPKPIKHVTLPIILAVIDKESSGIPIFNASDPLFGMNISMGVSWIDKEGKQFWSGMTRRAIKDAVVIASGPLKGNWAKFRFERGYWDEWAKHQDAPIEEKFLMACSFGLGQQMIKFVVEKLPPEKRRAAIYAFMGDVNQQIQWVIGNLEGLMARTTDLQLALTMYNAGPNAKATWRAYRVYGGDVLKRLDRIKKELKERSIYV